MCPLKFFSLMLVIWCHVSMAAAPKMPDVCKVISSKIDFRIGNEVDVVYSSKKKVPAVFLGVNKENMAAIALETGLIIYFPADSAQFSNSKGAIRDLSSIEHVQEIKVQEGKTCMATAPFNCLNFLLQRELLVASPTKERLRNSPSELHQSMVDLVSSTSIPLRTKAWDYLKSLLLRKSVGIEKQTARRAVMLRELGLKAELTSSPTDLKRHLLKGFPALLDVFVTVPKEADISYNQSTGEFKIAADSTPFSPAALGDFVSLGKERGSFGAHSVVAIGYGAGLYVIIDSNSKQLRIWKGSDVDRALSENVLGITEKFNYTFTTSATLVSDPES